MMWNILTIFACDLSGNSPPRFQSINGREVNYILGFAYIADPEQIFTAEAGETIEIDIEVSDVNGDEIELLFPRSPAGWEFDSDARSGVWNVPEEPLGYYYSLQALAIDEHGASDILFFDYGIGGMWDSGLWDTGFDIGTALGDIQYILGGNGNIENGFQGSLTLEAKSSFCSITWEYREPIAQELPPCSDCTRAWSIRPRQGQLLETSCDEVLDAYELDFSPEDLQNLEQIPEEISIGWTPSLIWNDIRYENAILYQQDEQWIPYGSGSVQNNRLEFSLLLH